MFGGGRFYYLNRPLAQHRLWSDCKSQGSSMAMALEKYALQDKYMVLQPERAADFREGLCHTCIWIAGLAINEKKSGYFGQYIRKATELSPQWFKSNMDNMVSALSRTIYQNQGGSALRFIDELRRTCEGRLMKRLNNRMYHTVLKTLIREKTITPAEVMRIACLRPSVLVLYIIMTAEILIRPFKSGVSSGECA